MSKSKGQIIFNSTDNATVGSLKNNEALEKVYQKLEQIIQRKFDEIINDKLDTLKS